MNQMWTAFPTAFISICDAVLDPAGYTVGDDARNELLNVLNDHSEVAASIIKDYRTLRDHVWREFMLTVPALPYWIAAESEPFFEAFFRRGLIEFDPHAGPVDLYMGSGPVVRLMPG